jgi:hypothetical protein
MYFFVLSFMDIGETPGGAAKAFCDAVIHISTFHLSTGSSSPPNIETASAIKNEPYFPQRSPNLQHTKL